MELFFQLIISGVSMGAVYSLVALGFVIVYKSTRIVNFAQGNLVMFGAYICFTMLSNFKMPALIGVLLALGVASLIGAVLERFCLRPLIGQPILAAIMVTIAISMILYGLAIIFWRPIDQVFPAFLPSGTTEISGFQISIINLGCISVTVLLVIAFSVFYRITKIGLQMRAVADSHQTARSIGIRVKDVFMWAWILCCIVASMAGILLGSMVGLNLSLGHIGLKAFPVVILGGLDSMVGAICGGLIVGVLESFACGYLDPIVGGGMREVAPFAIMILILLVKPYGLFGLKKIERI